MRRNSVLYWAISFGGRWWGRDGQPTAVFINKFSVNSRKTVGLGGCRHPKRNGEEKLRGHWGKWCCNDFTVRIFESASSYYHGFLAEF